MTDTKIRELVIENNCKEVLDEVKAVEGLTGIIVLALDKDGKQYYFTSAMKLMEVSLLSHFLNEQVAKWFRSSV